MNVMEIRTFWTPKLGRILAPMLVLGPESASAVGTTDQAAFGSLIGFLRAIPQFLVSFGFPVFGLYLMYIAYFYARSERTAEDLAKIRLLLFWAFVAALGLVGARAMAIAMRSY